MPDIYRPVLLQVKQAMVPGPLFATQPESTHNEHMPADIAGLSGEALPPGRYAVTDRGSYDFGKLPCKEEEFRRLEEQALFFWSREKMLLSDSGLTESMRVLDIGCGQGIVADRIARELVPRGQVVGIEPDSSLRSMAEALAAQNQRLTVMPGDIYNLEQPDESFDFVYARLVFQHLKAPVEALREIHRVLKPGGIALIPDVDNGWLTLYPEPPGFSDMLRLAEKAQTSYGGDRFVGRKLAGYMGEAGFVNVATPVEVLTSARIGLDLFLKIITCFKILLLMRHNDKVEEDFFERICRFAREHNSHGWVGIFCARGVKNGGQ